MDKDAYYGRVSSDRQEQEDTIQSQLAELRARLVEDGIGDGLEFVDEGYSRDDLERPALDRLRDLAGSGEVDRVYVQSPDRLASGAKLVLLVDEFRELGVEVVFLKGSVEDTPEGKLLLHMQGAIAEYERTKIVERTRRGKLYWAKQGAMVGGHAPYGYRFIRRTDTSRARLDVDEYCSLVVTQMYKWLVEEQMSVRAICKRLTANQIPTPRGATVWQPTSVDRILRNAVYKGTFYYQRAESVAPARRLSDDPYRKARKTGRKPRPSEDWISIPVPSIIDEGLWDRAQRQLDQNSRHSRRNNKRHDYLLRSLIRCLECGSTYSGQFQHGRRYYRCTNKHSAIALEGSQCGSRAMKADPIEGSVWTAVTDALRRPEVLVSEYERRLEESSSKNALEADRKQVALARRRIKVQEDRVTDAYVNKAMELDRYKVEMEKLGAKNRELDRVTKEIGRKDVRRQNKWDKRGAFKACNLDANRLRQFSDLPTSVRLDSFASPPVSSPVWRLGVRGTYPPA